MSNNLFSSESTITSLQERFNYLKESYTNEDNIEKTLENLEKEIDELNIKLEQCLSVYSRIENINKLLN